MIDDPMIRGAGAMCPEAVADGKVGVTVAAGSRIATLGRTCAGPEPVGSSPGSRVARAKPEVMA